ncbi:MAG: TIGR03960 family B12-binding radical SAM protein [candidate division WOR-3 bacterium]|nr:TIGR03960 family B12-binding radical SAM protein [candidate division WOR-3 bacterium]
MKESWQETFGNLLPQVQRPIRYTDSELHAVKHREDARVKIALVFPDTYEIGMSGYGLEVLYHIINHIPGARAERAFMPWVDMLERMKEHSIPLASLETRTPLSGFDMVGITLQSELGYTNALGILELAGIPMRSKDRKESDPLVVAGGPCTVNPLPLEPFFDAFCIGDGEDAIREITSVLLEAKDRKERISGLSGIEGVWVPSIHGRSKEIKRRTVSELRIEDTPAEQIVPVCDVEHDRLVVEIGRGCLRGCRFCQAGFSNRPARLRSMDDILYLAEKGLAATGWEEVCLLSFAVSDYPRLDELLARLNSTLASTQTAISLPSFRGETFNERIGRRLREIKKTGLTFAPETASPRLKRVINKNVSNASIIETVQTAARLGWRRVKLYFMAGLPGETPEDIDMNIEFIRELARSVNGLAVNVHTSAFVPKPNTPFQWAGFDELPMLAEKIARIRDEARMRRVKVKWARPEASFIEAVLARGDERLADVLEEVLQRGGYFQEWSEHFKPQRWEQSFTEHGVDPYRYAGPRQLEDELPWGFIDTGIRKEFLKAEYNKARSAQTQPDCLTGPCYACGAGCESAPSETCEADPSDAGKRPNTRNTRNTLNTRNTRNTRVHTRDKTELRYRLKFTVGEALRYASHLNLVRVIYRLLRRSGLPVEYTKGFSPHPRVRFSFPKPVGVTSRGEYVDVNLAAPPQGNLDELLAPHMPEGLALAGYRLIPAATPAVTKAAEILHYEVIDSPEVEAEELTKRALENADIHHVNAANGRLSLLLDNAQRAKLWNTLARLYNITDNEARAMSVERIDAYIKRGARLLTPLEESYQ